MLLWTYLLCLLAATFVASQSPEILADPGDGVEAGDPVQSTSESPHVIRELLRARETNACPFGYGLCPNIPGRCCKLGGRCCSYAAHCCSTGQSCCGTGCCLPGYHCIINIFGQYRCCPNGRFCIISTATPECKTPGYVRCSGENFCCPSGDKCSRDSDNNPKCSKA